MAEGRAQNGRRPEVAYPGPRDCSKGANAAKEHDQGNEGDAGTRGRARGGAGLKNGVARNSVRFEFPRAIDQPANPPRFSAPLFRG